MGDSFLVNSCVCVYWRKILGSTYSGSNSFPNRDGSWNGCLVWPLVNIGPFLRQNSDTILGITKRFIGLILMMVFTLVYSTPAYSKSLEPSPPELEELFQRTYGLLAASNFCQNKESFDKAALALKRIINYAKLKEFRLKSIEIFSNDPEGMIKKGAKKYGEQRWITCNEVNYYSGVVEELTKKL